MSILTKITTTKTTITFSSKKITTSITTTTKKNINRSIERLERRTDDYLYRSNLHMRVYLLFLMISIITEIRTT